MKRIESFGSSVYLVNTGWVGGPYGTGKRFKIPVTRKIIKAIQAGELAGTKTENIEGMNLDVPLEINEIDSNLLNPIRNWKEPTTHKAYSENLIKQFAENFTKFEVSTDIVSAGPRTK